MTKLLSVRSARPRVEVISMRVVIAWRLIKNSALYSRKTVFSLALVVALIISMGGIVNGLGQYASDIILRAGSTPYLIIYEKDKPLSESLIPNRTLDVLTHPSIRLIQPYRYYQVQYVTRVNLSVLQNNVSVADTVNNVGQNYDSRRLNFPLIATNVIRYLNFRNTSQILVGSYPEIDDDTNLTEMLESTNDILPTLVPRSFLSLMSEISVGDVLLVNISGRVKQFQAQADNSQAVSSFVVSRTVKLNVTGIFESTSLRDEAILIDHGLLLELFPELGSYYSFIEVYVEDPAVAIDVKLSVQSNLQKQQIDAVIEESQQSLTLLRLILNEILEKLLIFVLFLYFLAGFRLLTSQLWLLVLYQRELRILRVLGASPLYLASIFFVMGVLFFDVGFALGLVLGVGLPLILTFFFQISSSFPLINYHPNASDVIILFLAGHVVVFLTTLMLLPKFYDKNLVVPTVEIEL